MRDRLDPEPTARRDGATAAASSAAEPEPREDVGELRGHVQEARRIRQLADAVPAFISQVDAEQRFSFVNRTYVSQFQRPAEQLVGRTVAEVLGRDNYDGIAPQLEAALRGEQVRFDQTLQLPTGDVRHLDVTYVPDRRVDGSIAGCFVLALDVTERKQAEERLRESDRRKDDHLAMLGHELRNPLAALRSATELLALVQVDDPYLHRARRVLERQTEQMSRLIDGLLEVSRIARGKIALDGRPLDVREVLAGVLEDAASPIAARGLALDQAFPPQPSWIWGDPARLAQVFDNLVGNAIKFTPAPGRITVTVHEDDGWAVIRVRDTGIGIAPHMRARIFEPFQQGDQDIARAAGGLGLGLALAKGLVELHHGTIEAHSRGPGTGAELEVRLPLTSAPSDAPRPPRVPSARALQILLVEDNADAAEMMGALLEMQGHEVITASSGSEALARLRAEPVDLVLCDLGLPGMSGYEIARAIRADPALRELAVVALTGYGQVEDRERTASAGFDEHLVKPVDLRTLEHVLGRLARSRRHDGS